MPYRLTLTRVLDRVENATTPLAYISPRVYSEICWECSNGFNTSPYVYYDGARVRTAFVLPSEEVSDHQILFQGDVLPVEPPESGVFTFDTVPQNGQATDNLDIVTEVWESGERSNSNWFATGALTGGVIKNGFSPKRLLVPSATYVSWVSRLKSTYTHDILARGITHDADVPVVPSHKVSNVTFFHHNGTPNSKEIITVHLVAVVKPKPVTPVENVIEKEVSYITRNGDSVVLCSKKLYETISNGFCSGKYILPSFPLYFSGIVVSKTTAVQINRVRVVRDESLTETDLVVCGSNLKSSTTKKTVKASFTRSSHAPVPNIPIPVKNDVPVQNITKKVTIQDVKELMNEVVPRHPVFESSVETSASESSVESSVTDVGTESDSGDEFESDEPEITASLALIGNTLEQTVRPVVYEADPSTGFKPGVYGSTDNMSCKLGFPQLAFNQVVVTGDVTTIDSSFTCTRRIDCLLSDESTSRVVVQPVSQTFGDVVLYMPKKTYDAIGLTAEHMAVLFTSSNQHRLLKVNVAEWVSNECILVNQGTSDDFGSPNRIAFVDPHLLDVTKPMASSTNDDKVYHFWTKRSGENIAEMYNDCKSIKYDYNGQTYRVVQSDNVKRNCVFLYGEKCPWNAQVRQSASEWDESDAITVPLLVHTEKTVESTRMLVSESSVACTRTHYLTSNGRLIPIQAVKYLPEGVAVLRLRESDVNSTPKSETLNCVFVLDD